MPSETDPLDVTEFRFRDDNMHNARMLEFQAEQAFMEKMPTLAAAFAQAAGMYALAGLLTETLGNLDRYLDEHTSSAPM